VGTAPLTARREWRNEMWIDQPLEQSKLAQPMP